MVGQTGRGVRVAVVDSGVNAAHPHLQVHGVAGGVGIGPDGREHDDFTDRLGHGTAVAAAIREKAPDVELYAVKVFDRELATRAEILVAAIDWARRHQMRLINLSLGTAQAEHADELEAAVGRARECGALVVAAGEHDGIRWLPGSLPGVVRVTVDRDCPREEFRSMVERDGSVVFSASGFPRPIPGIPPERNLKGMSFAVANMTGFLARALVGRPAASFADVIDAMRAPPPVV